MPPKENLERACEECIHFFACSRQCGEPMAQRSATGCECYETVKSSMAYYVGTLDGAKGKIPNRLRELAEADKDGRVVVLPCRQGDELWTYCNHPVKRVYSFTVSDVSTLNGRTVLNTLGLGTIRPEDIGKTVFLTREEAEKALQEMEGKA
jgi:hypothetical protein|nr:MAG TPA: hypothetical protein [Caudoviricetes sp.]DAT58294.1 MAG TPA: hypothetical protein [Caudoviricetes sp.]